jgi:membrane protease YdiL (CAAX protease family)
MFNKNQKFTKTLLILALFYLFSILRGWYGYSILDPNSTAGEWFLILTKTPVWLALAYLLLKWWYPKNWLKVAGFKTFNWKTFLWTILATATPLIFFLAEEIFFPRTFYYKPNWAFSLIFFEIRNSLVEESLFRGFLQPFLNDQLGFWKGVIIQGLLFSIIHWCWWIFAGEFSISGAIYIFMLGIFWGLIKQKSGSIYPTLVAHTLHNLVLGMLL